MNETNSAPPHVSHPISLTGHELNPAQIETILSHVRQWSKTALKISDRLPLGADSTDVFRSLKPRER